MASCVAWGHCITDLMGLFWGTHVFIQVLKGTCDAHSPPVRGDTVKKQSSKTPDEDWGQHLIWEDLQKKKCSALSVRYNFRLFLRTVSPFWTLNFIRDQFPLSGNTEPFHRKLKGFHKHFWTPRISCSFLCLFSRFFSLIFWFVLSHCLFMSVVLVLFAKKKIVNK